MHARRTGWYLKLFINSALYHKETPIAHEVKVSKNPSDFPAGISTILQVG